MEYRRYQTIIAEAAHRPSLGRLLLGLATVLAVTIVWIALVLFLAIYLTSGRVTMIEGGALAHIGQPGEVIAFLLMIVGLGAGAWIAARVWQKRSLRSLTGRAALVLRHFVLAAALTWSIAALAFALTFPFSGPIVQNLSFGVWLAWLPVALIAVALQTGSEELLFRGYLQSQMAARFGHPLLWLVFPALLFGLAHFVPGLPGNAGLAYVGFATLFGVMAGDLTARTGSIGAAWGFHFANNALAILVVVADGSLTGLGLYRSGDLLDALTLSPLVLIDIAAMVVVWMVIRRMLSV